MMIDLTSAEIALVARAMIALVETTPDEDLTPVMLDVNALRFKIEKTNEERRAP